MEQRLPYQKYYPLENTSTTLSKYVNLKCDISAAMVELLIGRGADARTAMSGQRHGHHVTVLEWVKAKAEKEIMKEKRLRYNGMTL